MKNQKPSPPYFFKSFFFFFTGTLFLISFFFVENPLSPFFTVLTWGFILSYLLAFVLALTSLFKDTSYHKLNSIFILILLSAVTYSFYAEYSSARVYAKMPTAVNQDITKK